ncbi:putative glycosyltransferase [Pseudomonas sp. ATCC 13867]|uniref:glycosyltransferase n=1 Tax=Pseudomonas sp. ATCC 13867 TaxID=1294143 RepID=UPI0002C4E1D1|nr:glycosyltransferase [Pseudomonas sp. ATCC 13867]AGI21993.1 putative glycosyltransferase [Pseudomonas sp. ATCC 13867]RFQ29470.1 glycosyltransferase family 1 protein [Pseudomonas sp. ATCC 13867]
MKMIILVRSQFEGLAPSEILGLPGQGLHFLAHALWPVLMRLGEPVEVVADTDVAALCRHARDQGHRVAICSFGFPPPSGLEDGCPCFHVLPWAFDSLETAPEDWRVHLERSAGAITFSEQAARAIRRLMGADFPVLVSAAQPWERFAGLGSEEGCAPSLRPRTLSFRGQLLDSPSIGLSVDGLARPEPEPEPEPEPVLDAEPVSDEPAPSRWQQRLNVSRALLRDWFKEAFIAPLQVRQAPLEAPAPPPVTVEVVSNELPVVEQRVRLHGVVFTCVLRAEDETRNWTEMLTAFCWTFRDQPDATLVFKLTHSDLSSGRIAMLTNLSRLSPFQCRVVVINAYLEDAEYERLVAASHYLVHPAQSEASAITVQEFMSAGRPVLAPCHSALSGWVDDDSELRLRSSVQPAYWGRDPDKRLYLRDHRLDWVSFCEVFARGFAIAVDEPERYRALSQRARAVVRERASLDDMAEAWRTFFARTQAQASTGPLAERQQARAGS